MVRDGSKKMEALDPWPPPHDTGIERTRPSRHIKLRNRHKKPIARRILIGLEKLELT